MSPYPTNVAADGLLRARLDVEDGVATLSLAGDFDITAAHGFAALIEEIEGASPDRVVIDLHEITFLDSSAIRMLLELRTRAAGAYQLSVLDGAGPAHQMLRLVGLTEQMIGERPAAVRTTGPSRLR